MADPICTFLFSILVLFSTGNILRDALLVLMEGEEGLGSVRRSTDVAYLPFSVLLGGEGGGRSILTSPLPLLTIPFVLPHSCPTSCELCRREKRSPGNTWSEERPQRPHLVPDPIQDCTGCPLGSRWVWSPAWHRIRWGRFV